MQTKQTRTKFDNAKVKAKRPLQIVYTDLCDPSSSYIRWIQIFH